MDYLQKWQHLRNSLPRLAIAIVNVENCDFCNYIDRSRDCYLVKSVYESDKCMYGKNLFFCNFCIDCAYVEKCELCYQCIDSRECYNCNFCQDCESSSDCESCIYLKGCQNCFGCMNLRQKKYYIFNKPYNKEEYEKKISEFKKDPKYIHEEFNKIKLSLPHPDTVEENNEASSGHHIFNNKNVYNCFEAKHSQDCVNSIEIFHCEDCGDIMVGDYSKYCYYCCSAYYLTNSDFCYNCWESSDLVYCEQCYRCEHCLFCVNLNHKKYHIFNKPYSKENYFIEREKILNEMKENKSFGKYIASTYPEEDSLLTK